MFYDLADILGKRLQSERELSSNNIENEASSFKAHILVDDLWKLLL